MTAEEWRTGRKEAHLTQAAAALSLKVSQPYLSQLESGLRMAGAELAHRATKLYGLPATALPVTRQLESSAVSPNMLERKLASLGYPGFGHVRARSLSNPAEVLLSAVVASNLDTRLVEALPWLFTRYPDLNWAWLRDRAKLQNAQNRLGYLLHLAKETSDLSRSGVSTLTKWQQDLEESRLANEGTLCRDLMPEAEKVWLRENRPQAAVHWNLLTSLTADHLPYAAH